MRSPLPAPSRAYVTCPSTLDRCASALPALPDPEAERYLRDVRDLRAENVRLARQVQALTEANRELLDQVEALVTESSQLRWTVAELQEREARGPSVPAQAGLPETRGEDPLDLVRQAMGAVLGAAGSLLVDRVVERCGLSPEAVRPADVARVLDRLAAVAPRMAGGAEGEARLREELARVRALLESPGDTPQPPGAGVPVPPGPRAGGRVETTRLPAVPDSGGCRLPALPDPVPAPAPGDLEGSPAPALGPVEGNRLPALPEPPPAPSARVGHGTPPPQTETRLPALAEAPPVPERAPDGPPPLVPADDPELLGRLAEVRAQIAEGLAEEALDALLALEAERPGCLEVQSTLFEFFFAFECWAEAYGVAERLKPVLLDTPGGERFRGCLARVLERRVDSTRDPVEKKGYLLELAELHMDHPQEAAAWLQRARLLPERHPREGWIDLYLTRLAAGGPEERCRTLHGWMNRMADQADLFDHFRQVYGMARFREVAPLSRTILALARHGRRAAEDLEESREYRRLLPPPARPDRFFAAYQDARESFVLVRLLDDLLPRTGTELPCPSPEDRRRLAATVPASRTWEPARLAAELRQQMFGGDLQLLRYEGPEDLLVHPVPGGTPSLLLSPSLDGVPAPEVRALVAGALYRLRRRHLELERLVACLDPELSARLVKAAVAVVLESGGALPEDLHLRVRDLDRAVPPTDRLYDLVERLHDSTRADAFRLLLRLFRDERPFAEDLERAADQFTALAVGPTAASFAAARGCLGAGPLLERCATEGFACLYGVADPAIRALRLRLQRLWLGPLRAVQR